MIMDYVTQEQIKAAKSIPLLDFLMSTERYNLRKAGNEYRLKDHDSFAVSNGKFHWRSRDVGGFESPIDILSHKTLQPDYDGYRLSLGGTVLAALAQFLAFSSDVRYLDVCTDNDAAGDACAARIAGLKGVTAIRCKPPRGKDWNESLR
jgi:hypothetical protein